MAQGKFIFSWIAMENLSTDVLGCPIAKRCLKFQDLTAMAEVRALLRWAHTPWLYIGGLLG